MFLIHMERKKGVRASGVLFGYWLLCFPLPATSAAQLALQGVSGGPGGPICQFQALCPVLPPRLSTHDLLSTQRHTPQLLKLQQCINALPHTGAHILPYIFHGHKFPLPDTRTSHTLLAPPTHTCFAPLCASHNHRLRPTHLHTAVHTCCQPVCPCLQTPT